MATQRFKKAKIKCNVTQNLCTLRSFFLVLLLSMCHVMPMKYSVYGFNCHQYFKIRFELLANIYILLPSIYM